MNDQPTTAEGRALRQTMVELIADLAAKAKVLVPEDFIPPQFERRLAAIEAEARADLATQVIVGMERMFPDIKYPNGYHRPYPSYIHTALRNLLHEILRP